MAAIAPPNTRKSRINKMILGRFFFSGAADAGPGRPGAPGGGAPIGLGIGATPGAAPIAGARGAPPGAGRDGPPLGASSEGLGPPGAGTGPPGAGKAGEGGRVGEAKVGTGPGAAGVGSGAAGACPTLGRLGVGLGIGAGAVAGAEGATGAGGDGSPGVGGCGAAAAGEATPGEGIGAGVPSVGLILGANGERVTLNLGPPSPGLTGAPSLGVSLSVGLGGLGVPCSDIRNQFKGKNRTVQAKDLIFGGVFLNEI